ncbi:hypothetical protein [Oceanicoccus sagamiensis]|uniref:Uncharacterized protein n=1 Tax=Oceanicoccus sagamiensis TaxID=716816 RepID=A0A1X9NF10_9GAMM|nr:hypothetical protein [Oceanicoccus sagamiensis]ARN75634.1 hypothetical protein BST96_16885 [Oceanicoccus sagamiensis]
MPYKITWLDQTVIADFYGDVTVQEIRDHGREVNNDLRFKKVSKRISNCSAITSINASTTDLKIFGFIDHDAARYAPDAHMAVVTEHPSIIQNTAQYKAAFGDGSWKIKLFPSIGEALAWDPDQDG